MLLGCLWLMILVKGLNFYFFLFWRSRKWTRGGQLKIICLNNGLNLLLFLDKNSARNFIRCLLTHCTVGRLAVPLGAPAAHLPALPGGITRHLRRDARYLYRRAFHRLQGRTTEYWKHRRKQRLSTTKYLWIDSYQNLKGLLDFVVVHA